jgi:hypothetical protein
MRFEGKWIEFEDIMLSEIGQAQKDKKDAWLLSHVRQTQCKYKQYYEKQVILRGRCIQEREGKRRKLRRWIWLMYFLCKNEYRIFKPVEITIRRQLRLKGEKIDEMNQFGLYYICTWKCYNETPYIAIPNKQKFFFFFWKAENRRGKQALSGPVGGERI